MGYTVVDKLLIKQGNSKLKQEENGVTTDGPLRAHSSSRQLQFALCLIK